MTEVDLAIGGSLGAGAETVLTEPLAAATSDRRRDRGVPVDRPHLTLGAGATFHLPALVGADVAAVAVGLLAAPLLLGLIGRPDRAAVVGRLVYVPVYIAVLAGYGLYRRSRRRLAGSTFPDVSHLVHAMIVAGIATILVAAEAHRLVGAPPVSAEVAALAGLLAVPLVTQFRAASRWALSVTRTGGSRVLLVGSGIVANRVLGRLGFVRGLEVVGWIDDEVYVGQGSELSSVPRLGSLSDLFEVVERHDVDHVIVAFSPAAGSTMAAHLRDLSAKVQISIVPRLFDLLSARSHVEDLRGIPVVDVAPPALGPADRFIKRLTDIVVSGVGLVVLSPVLLAIAVAVKLTSPGPVLFPQERTGRQKRKFRIYKFRTMRTDADQVKESVGNEVDGPLFKARRDPRVTSVGRLLRTTSLDELPQLINVLKGEMSLVGPRPFIPVESDEIRGWAERRFDVRPGMTGLWQVSGRSDLPFDELCRLDYCYVASWSLWWDLHILWHTPASVLKRHGAY